MFEIQCGKKQQDDRVCMGHFWILMWYLTGDLEFLSKMYGLSDASGM